MRVGVEEVFCTISQFLIDVAVFSFDNSSTNLFCTVSIIVELVGSGIDGIGSEEIRRGILRGVGH